MTTRQHAPDPPDLSPQPGTWHRLDPRMLAVFPAKQLGTLIPVLAAVLIGGRDAGGWQLVGAVAAPVTLVAVGVLRWLTLRYRVSAERVELRKGLVAHQQRSLRRELVRTVDLRASPLHRLFGLTVVEIGTGTGTSKEGRLSLDGVTAGEGERLRRELLSRSPRTEDRPSTAKAPPARPVPTQRPVAQLHLAWLRYAPLTASGLAAIGALVGTVFKVANDAGVDLAGSVYRAGGQLSGTSLWAAGAALVAAVSLLATVGSLAIYILGWWNYRLGLEPDDTLRLRRGLFTTRSLSIEQRRMRGAEVTQPLLLRLAGGARCAALTTGLDAKTSSGGSLLPPAPLAEAHRVAASALLLGDTSMGTAAMLVRHPPSALRRRATRALLPALGLVVLAWWLSERVTALTVIWPAAILALPLAALLAADRYRNLGHALRPDYLVIGYGSLVRRRVALQRRGIIGWRLRQSPLQRWAGLVTLDAVAAAGKGHYSVVDISSARAVELVNRVNPGLLAGDRAPIHPSRSTRRGAAAPRSTTRHDIRH